MADRTNPATPEMLALANRLVLARARAGLSQAEAARRSRCGRSYLSELENAKHVPSALMLASLAAAYGVRVGELLGEQPVPAPATVDRDAAEDFRHDMAMRAFCAPDSDYDTIRASLDARIADALAASAPAPVSEDQEQREVQRVAEAIQTAALDKPGVSYLRVDYWDHEDLQNMARAAIAALREVPRG